MPPELKDRIEQLKMKNAVRQMDPIGRLLVDNRERSLWEQDTSTLPWGARHWRKRAQAFARDYIRPQAPAADLHPYDYNPKPLLTMAAQKGFQSLLLIPPFGRARTGPYLKSATLQIAVVAEEFAVECGGLALLLLAHNLGIVPLILSGSLKTYFRHLLPFYLKSTLLGQPDAMAFAITEPGAGSDVEETEGGAQARLVTTAQPAAGGYILNGRKCFITNGAIADKITVYARLTGEGLESWTCFLIEKDMKGFTVGRQEKKMGQRAADASELIFEDVFVPQKNVIGKPRSGWANCRNVLNYSRPVVGAMALGHGRGAFERCLDFCRKTTLGPKRLIDYQEVQQELADMIISLWAARSMVWQSCRQFRSYQSASAAAKVFASDTAFKVCSQAMELMGDHGYLHSHGVERAWRDARLTQIYEGTNQINRLALIEHHWQSDIAVDKPLNKEPDTMNNFFSVHTRKIETSQGEIDLPIFYYDFGYAHFWFWADYDKVLPLLEGTIFRPCQFFNGKAGVMLNFFEYRDCAIGPYNEVGLSIFCYPKTKAKPGAFLPQLIRDAKKWTIGGYVINLPVTTEIANAGGREIWSYPKFVTAIDISLNGRQFHGSVEDPDLKAPLVTLDGKMGLMDPKIRMAKASFISHTTHHGTPLRTLTEVNNKHKVNVGFSRGLVVNEQSTHNMTQNLLAMGLQGEKPFMCLSCEKTQMILFGGDPIR